MATTLDQVEAAWADLIQRVNGFEVVAAQGGDLALLLPGQGVTAGKMVRLNAREVTLHDPLLFGS